ncbi:MAG: hypothetical protein LBC69_00760 [Eubacteriaceae bacterium]|jgi:hypothetical protein|nr:hypothetical protein [Eubacteriaceae bacterium]
MNLRSRVIVCLCFTFLSLLSSCQTGFERLGIGNADNLRTDINKFLQKSHPFKLPEFIPSEGSENYLTQYYATTENGVTLTLTKGNDRRERLTVEMAIDKKGNQLAVEEFIGLMSSVINRFSGFDYIEPIGEQLVMQGSSDGTMYKAERSEEGFAYGFTIDLTNGYVFDVKSL